MTVALTSVAPLVGCPTAKEGIAGFVPAGHLRETMFLTHIAVSLPLLRPPLPTP